MLLTDVRNLLFVYFKEEFMLHFTFNDCFGIHFCRIMWVHLNHIFIQLIQKLMEFICSFIFNLPAKSTLISIIFDVFVFLTTHFHHRTSYIAFLSHKFTWFLLLLHFCYDLFFFSSFIFSFVSFFLLFMSFYRLYVQTFCLFTNFRIFYSFLLFLSHQFFSLSSNLFIRSI